MSDVEKASRFLYLNKAGFNGMYRVNKSGGFNVPFGKGKTNLKIYDEENFKLLKEILSNPKIIFKNVDYLKILNEAKKGDLLFVDPPYDDTYSSYTKEGFDKEDQTRLANKLKELDRKGIKWILCNNPTVFILEKYKDFNQCTLPARRSINSDGEKRKGMAKEVFITNFVVGDFDE